MRYPFVPLAIAPSAAVLLQALACGRVPPETLVSPTAVSETPAPQPSSIRLSGRVVERFSGEPMAGVQVWGVGPSWSWQSSATTDQSGVYELGDIRPRSSLLVSRTSAGPRFVQQCAVYAPEESGSGHDIAVTSERHLSEGNTQAPPPIPGKRVVQGTVFEGTGTERRPVEGAMVAYVSWDQEFAHTVTGASGRYLLCGVETGMVQLSTGKAGYTWVHATIAPGPDTVFDIHVQALPASK